jgi:hypothetical protein
VVGVLPASERYRPKLCRDRDQHHCVCHARMLALSRTRPQVRRPMLAGSDL